MLWKLREKIFSGKLGDTTCDKNLGNEKEGWERFWVNWDEDANVNLGCLTEKKLTTLKIIGWKECCWERQRLDWDGLGMFCIEKKEILREEWWKCKLEWCRKRKKESLGWKDRTREDTNHLVVRTGNVINKCRRYIWTVKSPVEWD